MRIDSVKIKLKMAESGMSVIMLAKASGISRQGIGNILTRGTCQIANAGKLAKALGVCVQEIIKEE